MKVTVKIYPPFKRLGGYAELELQMPEGAVLEDLLKVLALEIDGIGQQIPWSGDNRILWGSLVPVMNGKVIGYRDLLQDGSVIQILGALDGG
jgi:hypothetical protein